MEIPDVTASNCSIPAIGLGTWKLRGKECERTVRSALEVGYRHIDTAAFYDNEDEVGQAISDFNSDRLFITTKVWKDSLRYGDFKRSTEDSLIRLGLERVDLLLIHWPNPEVPIEETLEAMHDLVDEGKVEHIGVSNFSKEQLDRAIEKSSYPLVNNQVEYHLGQDRDGLLKYCRDNSVSLTAYSPLGKGDVLGNETVRNLAAKYGKTPGQIALKWLIEQDNVIAIPKASSRDHLEENIDLFDWELAGEDIEEIHRA